MTNTQVYRLSIWGVMALSLSPALLASDLDELMGGFDEPTTQVIIETVSDNTPSGPWQLSGSVGLTGAYAYQHGSNGSLPFTNNLAHLIADTHLQLDYNQQALRGQVIIKGQYDGAFDLNGRANYPTTSLDNYEHQIELDQAWIQTSISDDLDIKLGRQQLVLGKLDIIAINDRMHSLDNRYPGLTDIDDLRLPTLMTRLDYYLQNWQASVAISHEVRAPKIASLGVDAFPSSAFPSNVLSNMPALAAPSYSVADAPYMLTLLGNVSGWDIAMYHGRTLDNRWHQVTSPTPMRQYGYVKQNGLAASTTAGSWLWKMEAATITDMAFSNVSELKQRTDFGIGFDYNGWQDLVWTVELASRNYADFEVAMAALPNWQVEHDLQLVNAVQYQFNRNRSSLTLLANYYGNDLQGGGMHKLWFEHELAQDFHLTIGLIDYASGDSVLAQALADSDKISLGIERQF